jgi:predicted phosphodiesterase
MKILALYDIHGNLDALNAVLADPRAEGPDVIVIGGDVAPGPFVPATLDRLDALALPRRWVRGNGEREVAAAVDVAAPDAALVVAGHTHQQDDRGRFGHRRAHRAGRRDRRHPHVRGARRLS